MRGYNLSGLSVLIVDDHPFMRKLLASAVRAFGITEVSLAEDGFQASEILQSGTPDIILTDWNMPNVDGIALVHSIRSGAYGSDPYVPIIMISGYREKARVSEAAASGIHDYLAKPLTARTLYSRIVNLIEQPRPFIRTATYFGPERRLRRESVKEPDLRSKPRPAPEADKGTDDSLEIELVEVPAESTRTNTNAPRQAQSSNSATAKFEVEEPPVQLRSKVTSGGPDAEAAIAGGEAAFAGMSDSYRESVSNDLAVFRTALARARSDTRNANEHLSNIYNVAHDIRGQGSTYDYPLLTGIGDSLCSYIETLKQVDGPQLKIIDLHGEAMSRIVADEIKSEDDAVGRTLLSGLKKVTMKRPA